MPRSLIIPAPTLYADWRGWAEALRAVLEGEQQFQEAEVPFHGDHFHTTQALDAGGALTEVASLLYASTKVKTLVVFDGVVKVARGGADVTISAKLLANATVIYAEHQMATVPSGAGDWYTPIAMTTIFDANETEIDLTAQVRANPGGGDMLHRHLWMMEMRNEPV